MKSKWQLKEKSCGDLIVSVEGEIWKNAQEKAFLKRAKKISIPGFRAGHVPTALARKQIGVQAILMDAVDEVASEALSESIKEHDLWVVSRPALSIESIDENQVTFKFLVPVKPIVKLCKYKGLNIKKESVKVSEADLKSEITRLQEQFADMVVKEKGKVANEDTAVIDFEGFKDGIPFEGGKGENYPLVIGSGSFIPGFEEQVLGMKVDQEKAINVKFPADYQAAELAGCEVVFNVVVHEIKQKVYPAVDDDLIAQAKIENVKTVDDFKAYSRKQLQKKKENEAENVFENEILTQISEGCKVDIPDAMIEEETNHLMQDFQQRLKGQGMDLEQFYKMSGQKEDQIRKEMQGDALRKVKIRLILEAVAAEEKIEIDQAKMEAEYKEIAEKYQMELSKVKELINDDAIKYDLKIREALTVIKSSIA